MFRLKKPDLEALRLQFAISKTEGRGGRRFAPYAFTEQGVAMLSSVLRSSRAVQVNLAIIEGIRAAARNAFESRRGAAQN